ncbi:MAG: hypothetical protein RL398_2888 [Planctomycetota bacterium]|jgi:hypothetical protein
MVTDVSRTWRRAMTWIPKELEEAFFAGRRSSALPFVLNDTVEVVSGHLAGRGGAVISIVSVEPEMVLLVELGDGSNVQLVAEHLRRDDDAG